LKDTQENLEFKLLKNKLSHEELASELGELNYRLYDIQKTFNELINQSYQQSQQ